MQIFLNPMKTLITLAQLAEHFSVPAAGGARSQRWDLEALPASSHFLDYIPGRDKLFDASALAAGALPCGCVPFLL